MPTSPHEPPPTYLEQKRWEAQEAYKAELAYFKAQEPTFKRLIEEDRERQQKEMSGSLFGMLTGQSGPLAILTGKYDPSKPPSTSSSASGNDTTLGAESGSPAAGATVPVSTQTNTAGSR
jgi:import inner membrane translocase subunit TIM50